MQIPHLEDSVSRSSRLTQNRKPSRTVFAAACLGALLGLAVSPASAALKAEVPADVKVLEGTSSLKNLKLTKPTSSLRVFLKEGALLQLPSAAAKVLVATPGIASYQMPSPDQVFFFGTAAGSTTFYALDEAGAVIAAVQVTVEHNLEKLKADIKRAVPSASIELVPALNNRMIVRGKVKTALDSRRVTQLVESYLVSSAAAGGPGQGGEQGSQDGGGQGGSAGGQSSPVINQLKVEVSRSLTHSLGFNWGAVLNTGRGPLFLGNGTSQGLFSSHASNNSHFNPDGSFEDGNANIPGLMPDSNTAGAALGGIFNMGRMSLGVLINAMSESGFASLLAEPNLTAMSGQPAAFASGGEVPIVIITGNSITIDYKSWGVILRMTPTVLSPNRIAIHVAPEVSELTSEGQVILSEGSVIPAVRVRRAETTVELASGQSFALAGMLRSESSQTVNGVPGLRNLPFVGRLFEYEQTQVEDSELVILLTANIVDPVSSGDLRVPGRGINAVDAYAPRQASIGYLF